MSKRLTPIVVKLGKESKKRLEELQRGEGKLTTEVAATLAEVKSTFGDEAANRTFVPIVLVYKKKEKKGNRLGLPLF
jgi:hypothetical protein